MKVIHFFRRAPGKSTFLLALALLLSSPPSSAAEKAKSEGNVLNFDADVIQGERQRPDLFIQLGNQPQSLESVLYGRKDFNDFHQVDRLWRPSFYVVDRPQQRERVLKKGRSK